MRALLRFFIERHLLVDVLTVGLVVLGVVTALQTEREGFPAVDLDLVVVTAALPGAATEDVEAKVVGPLEEAIATVDGVDTYTSRTSPNLAVIRVELHEGLTPEESREVEADLRRAVESVDLPDSMEDDPVVSRANPGRIPVLEIALSGPSVQLPEAAERLERALEGVDELSSVTTVGVTDPEVRVLLDVGRAQQHGVALLDVVGALQRRNVSGTGGTLETAGERRQVVLRGEYASLAEVEDTVLRASPDGGTLRISDVARVELGRRDDGLRVHTNGEPGASIVVRKRDGADILDAADRVRAVVQATELPPGVTAVLVNDGSFLTRNRLSVMASNGALGLILVVISLFVFLTPRTAFWVAFGVPVVLLGVLVLMPQFGITVNVISVAGMVVVLGLLVDDAVVVAERIVHHQNLGLPAAEAALEGTSSMVRPVTAAALTTMLAFSPILGLGGLPGKIAWNIPAVVVLALIVSLLEGFFILPAHIARGERADRVAPKRRFVLRLEDRYRRALRWTTTHKYWLLLGFFGLLAVTMGGIRPRMPFTLFPQDDSDALYVKVEMPPGTPIEHTEAAVTAIERQIPPIVGGDLLAVTARIGHQDPDALDREVGEAGHQGVISVLCKPLDRARTSAQWIAHLGETLVIPEGAKVSYEARVIGPPMGRPVTVHVSGNDEAARRSTALALADRLRAMDGLVEVEVDEEPGVRRVDLKPDWEKLALYGLDGELVSATLTAALYGLPATEVRTVEGAVQYRVRLDSASRGSLDSVLDTPVRTRAGGLVLLRDLVRPVELPSVATIHHRAGVRTATVGASFAPDSGHTARSMGLLLENEVFPGFAPPGVTVEMGGEFTETAETMGGLAVVGLLAVLGITLVIAVMLNSVLDALFVVVVIPFGVVGVILAFFAHGRPLSLFAMLGGIGLAGVVVNASIVMVDAVKQRVASASEGDETEAMIDAVVERLRPILVTTISTLGGVLPTAYGLGGYDAVLSPMSLALGWGLAFSTGVTLFLVPALYGTAQDLRRFWARRRGLRTPEYEPLG